MDGRKLLAEHIAATNKPKAEFARRVGCSQGHLSLILSGARGVSLNLAKRISDETNGRVPIESLVLVREGAAA